MDRNLRFMPDASNQTLHRPLCAGELNRYGARPMRLLILGALLITSPVNAVYVPDCNPATRSLSATEAAGLGISVVWGTAYGPKAVCQTLVVLAPKQLEGRDGNDVIVGDRTIDVHIRKLREKIGVENIKTLKGIGYKFDF